MKPYLSIIIPVFNEQENISILLHEIYHALENYDKQWEIIVVDDGSTDETFGCATEYQISTQYTNITVIQFRRNFGQTAAMQAGIDFAKGDVVVTMDGDLQNNPNDILPMLQRFESRELDLLCGWRKNRQDHLWKRKLPSMIANKIIAFVTQIKLNDYGCSLKIYRASIIKNIKLYGEMHRFIPAFVAMTTAKTKIEEYIVSHQARQFGKSKYGLSRVPRVLCDIIFLFFMIRYYQKPGHFFGVLTFFFMCASAFILSLSCILSWYLVFFVFLCCIVGTMLIAMGIIGEILIRIYYSNHKSYYIKSESKIVDDEQ